MFFDVICDMTFLELFPVYVSLLLRHPLLSNKHILYHIDNMAVVQVLNTLTSKSTRVMNIVRKLVLLTLQHNITIKAQHIPTKLNKIADSGESFATWLERQRCGPHSSPSRYVKFNCGVQTPN